MLEHESLCIGPGFKCPGSMRKVEGCLRSHFDLCLFMATTCLLPLFAVQHDRCVEATRLLLWLAHQHR